MTLLLFPQAPGRTAGWWRVEAGAIAARGGAWADLAPLPGERIVLAAPGEAVALHWIELPALAAAQARAAARLAAAEVVAAPLDTLHIAIGGGDGHRPMAVVARGALADWLAQAQAAGIDPDHVVPEPLLLAAPAAGDRHWPRDGATVIRGVQAGYAAEPALAALLTEGPVDAPLTDDMIAAELVLPPLLDLRQGPFAKRRQWRIDAALVRRLAGIAAAILVVTLALQLVLILRYQLATSRAEAQAETAARAVLPRATRIADPVAQLEARLADLRGGGLGFTKMAGVVIGAVRDTGGVELSAMAYDGSGQLTATVQAPGPAEIDAMVARIGAAGLIAAAGAPRGGGGRQVADLTVTAR